MSGSERGIFDPDYCENRCPVCTNARKGNRIARILQQARPPDGTMKAGTKVILVEEAGSYCPVQNEDGIEGYVVADSVKAVGGKE